MDYQQKFSEILQSENKEEAVKFALGLIESEQIGIVELYTNILGPALNNMYCTLDDKVLCVWKEHVRTAIVRTIVESCYIYVLKEREKAHQTPKGTAVIVCPPEEYHDLGARMVADFFTICGYEAVFIGSNTPFDNFFDADDLIKPDVIAISVSNYYNIVITKKIIEDLRKKIGDRTKIFVGGYAFTTNKNNVALVGADYYAGSFEDIKKIIEGEDKQ